MTRDSFPNFDSALRRLFFGLLLVYLATFAGVLHAVDELAALTVAESLLDEGGWHANQMAWDQERTPPQNSPGHDGRLYTKKGIGISLAVLPLLAVGKAVDGVGAIPFTLLLNAGVTALAVAVFCLAARDAGVSGRVTLVAGVMLGLATPLWPYSRTLFSEPLAALGLSLGFWGVIRSRSAYGQSAAWLALASVGMAIMVLAKPSNAVATPALLLYGLWRVWPGRAWRARLRDLTALGGPLTVAVAGTILYNWLRFGSFLSVPLEPFERFSTPLVTGLAGLLVSPGKGLVWHMPILFLLGWSFVHARHRSLIWLGLGAALPLIALYALWYDWPGGRAWGPRMIVVAVPALCLALVPGIARLMREEAGRGARWILGAVLVWSIAAQVPGVLVNFEQQEAQDMYAGIRFSQLLWEARHAPLLTYWQSRQWDPVWLQPDFFHNAGVVIPIVLCAAGLAGIAAWPGQSRRREIGLWLAGLLLGVGAGSGLALAATHDARWSEQNANTVDSLAVLQHIQSERLPRDVVLLDMQPDRNPGERQAVWMTHSRLRAPSYLVWSRQATAEQTAMSPLADWLASHGRVWLVLVDTGEGDPTSTTEAWLDGWSFRGRQAWYGSQRVVEYFRPVGEPDLNQGAGVVFEDKLVLQAWEVGAGATPAHRLVRLVWATTGAPWDDLRLDDLRFSVQILSDGVVTAQVDRAPAGPPNFEDRVGLMARPGADLVILKVYSAVDGAVLAPSTGGEFVVLASHPATGTTASYRAAGGRGDANCGRGAVPARPC